MIENARGQFGIARRIIRPVAPDHPPDRLCGNDGCPWDILGARSGHWRGILHRGSTASIGFTRCRPDTDCRGPEHLVGNHVITFPRAGVFVMHIAGGEYIADPNSVVFSNRDDSFRTSHPSARGDDTLWLAVEPGVILDAVGRFDPSVADHPGRPFPFTHGPCEPRTFLLHQSLFRSVAPGATRAAGPPDPLRTDEIACALVAQAVASGFALRGVQAASTRPGTDAAHRRTVEDARALLAVRFRDPLSIAEIASECCISPFHLCRIFRRHAGVPIHRYLNRLRLRAAVDRLLDGPCHLADLAIAVGFASHSHFSDAFRREFGSPPSTVRADLARTR